MAKHPLQVLREALGLSEAGHARLLAGTYQALGHGVLSTWQARAAIRGTERDEPERSVQLAIAHIHHMGPEEVDQYGWPHFLLLATGDITPPTAPWPPAYTTASLRTIPYTAAFSPPTLTGAALTAFVRQTRATLAAAPSLRSHSGRPIGPDTVSALESRAAALRDMSRRLSPAALLAFARTDLSLVTTVLNDNADDPAARARLFLAASKIAQRCGHVHCDLGDAAQAERYLLSAVRASASAGAPVTAAACLSDLAVVHTDDGDPRDALNLTKAARSLAPTPPPRLATVLHAREARAHARLRNATASLQALDRAADTMTSDADNESPWSFVSEEWLSEVTGKIWLHLGHPRKALENLLPLLDFNESRPSRQPSCVADLLTQTASAYLALDEVESALQSAHRTADLLHQIPASLAFRYRRQFHHHRTAPAVRELLDRLDPHGSQ
ncbi:hypothetical protein AB0M92_23980 [Streptomyces sp. NPDC051582]|uniref:hypothetical protein n=1 Tax=Streptomyces sp. NPDC051582 TaxID=3155167 RepID=UPI003443F5AE